MAITRVPSSLSRQGRRPGGLRRTLACAGAALAALTVLASTEGVSGATASASGQFVTASGTQLFLNGARFRFTGYNSYQLPSLMVGAEYNCGGIYGTSWLDRMLDEIVSASHSTVIRTWFFQSYSADDFIQFDTVLAAAAARGVKIIPVLANEWGTCEGPTLQMPYKGLSWYQGGYKQSGGGYTISYRDYAIQMARRYANNPTIAFWQLMNETEALDYFQGPCEESSAAHAIRAFADDVTDAMKAVDPNHLVSLGTMGGGQCGTQYTDFQYVHAGAVDLCEYHDYWNAYLGGTQWNGAVVDSDMCHALNKPIFVGEAGLDASIQADWHWGSSVTSTSLDQRAADYQQKLQAQFALGISGYLIWSKSLSGSSSYDVGSGDPTEAVLAAQQQQLVAADQAPRVTRGDPFPQHAPGASAADSAASPVPATGTAGTAGGSAAAPAASSTSASGQAAGTAGAASAWELPRYR